MFQSHSHYLVTSRANKRYEAVKYWHCVCTTESILSRTILSFNKVFGVWILLHHLRPPLVIPSSQGPTPWVCRVKGHYANDKHTHTPQRSAFVSLLANEIKLSVIEGGGGLLSLVYASRDCLIFKNLKTKRYSCDDARFQK